MFILNPRSGVPVYRQLVEQVRRRVASGELKPGTPMPSVRDVAAEHDLNRMTISKAYALLENEGVLERHRGKRMVIAAQSRAQKTARQRIQQIKGPARDLVLAAKQLQLSKRDMVTLLSELWEDEDA